MLNDGCPSPRNSRIGLPASKKPSRITSAKSSSRAMMRVRCRVGKGWRIDWKMGTLPSGSMMKKSVAAAESTSAQAMVERVFMRSKNSPPLEETG